MEVFRPKYIKAEFEIVTPMFLGGAEHEAGRIRETSVKGALAFWWRALNYADFVKEAGKDQDKALHNMRKREIALFGGETEQGAFSLTVEQDEPKIQKADKGKILGNSGQLLEAQPLSWNNQEVAGTIGVGARYLGYGILESFTRRKNTKGENEGNWCPDNIKHYAGELTRSCLMAGNYFTVQIMFRDENEKAMSWS